MHTSQTRRTFKIPSTGNLCFSRHFFVKWANAFPGYPCESIFVWVDFSCLSLPRGFWLPAWLLSQEQRPSVVHYEPGEQRFHGGAKFKFYCYIPRPLEAIARCLEQIEIGIIFSLCSSEDLERLEWKKGNFCRFFLGQGRTCFSLSSL